MDSNQTILKSAAKFLSGTMISRVTGLLRDISMAWAFGTAAPLAAFFVAFRLTNVPRRILGEGGMQTAFIPQYEALKKQDASKAHAFFRDLHAFMALGLALLIGVVMAGIYPFLGDDSDVLKMTFLMLPSLYFICLYALNAAFIQSEGSYFTPGVAPIAFNIIWILAALFLSSIAPDEAMVPLALSICLGAMGQWLMTVPKTISKLSIPLFTGWDLKSSDLKILIKPLFLANLGVVATQINSGLDPLFARWAHPEGPAWLWYAIRIEQLPLALFGIALSSALLPPLSRAAKQGMFLEFKTFLITALKRSSYLMVPITCLIFILGRFSVKLLFGRGDFGEASIDGTTLCLWGYGAGLLFQTWVLILAPAFYALGNYKTAALGSILSVGINLCLNTLFIFGLNWGPESVAWATSISALFNALFLGSKLFSSHFASETP